MTGLWETLSATGGSLALVFIVALVLGICATAVLFFGSAVVVLERFAREARSRATMLVVTLALAALLGLLGTDEETVESLGVVWPGAFQAWAISAAVAFAGLLLAQLATVLALRFVPPRALALASVVGLGAGYALLVGGLDQLGYALAPALVSAALACVFRWRRKGLPGVWRRSLRGASARRAAGEPGGTARAPGSGLALEARPAQRAAGEPGGTARAPGSGLALEPRPAQRAAGERSRSMAFDERLAWTLASVLGLGVAIPLALDEANLRVGSAGATLLGLFVLLVLLGLLPRAAAGFIDAIGSAEWFIARRYLFAKRRQTFISLITGICVAGVAAGVWLIIIVLSVMNGFEQIWRDEIIGNRAHLTVHAMGPIEDYRDVLAKLEAIPEVVGAAPYLDAEGMVRGQGGGIVGVRVRGIDPALVGAVTDLRADLLPGSEGALEDLAPRPASGNGAGPTSKPVPRGEPEAADPGIVIGSQLAAAVGVGVGDSLLLISPFGGPPTPLGPGPRLARFRVAGVFQTGFFQYDEIFTYVSLAAAQDFRRAADVADGIEVRTTDYYRSQRVGAEIERALGFPYFTRDWKEFFPSFFQALKTERVMMFVLLTMIMVVAAFAIVVTLVMMIMEKSADIAILKAMGATDAAVERIFAIEGTLIGLLGTLLGVVSGIAVTARLGWVQTQIEALTGIDTLPAEIYQLGTLPSEVDPLQVGIVVAIAMVLALGATLLPSRQGASLDPAESLRYE